MFHVNWTDAPIWSPLIRWMGLVGPVDPYRGFANTNALTGAFFDSYLKGEPGERIHQGRAASSPVRVEFRPAR